jgi:ubiquinone/menaquinone biosynthesis C-methylase UbiE
VARSYERYVRGLCQTALTRRQMDWDSEYLLYRSLLGGGGGALLDLGCGTGLFARRLARDPDLGPVVGMDVSKPMIEEGVAQSREEGALVDFVRCRAPALPFQDASLGGILQAGSLHWVPELGLALREIARALRPEGAYVLSTYLPPRRWKARIHARLGLHPRSEEELRQALTAAGLARVQRVLLPPWLVMKAEKEKG